MQCPTCGRQLTAQEVSGGFCPSCGTPVAAMQQSTPAAVIPAVVPLPPDPMPTPLVTPAPAMQAAPQLAAMPSAPANNGNRAGLFIGLGVLVIVILALLALFFLGKGGTGPFAALGATPTPAPTATATATTTPPTPTPVPTVAVPAPGAGFSTFQASDGSYGLNYPSGWLTTGESVQGETLQVFISSDTSDYFITLPSPQVIPASQYAALAQQFATGLGGTDIKISAQPTKVTLGSNTWNKVLGTLTYQSKPYSAAILGVDHGTGTFLVLYLAPTSSFKSVETTDFTVMATSITFAGA